MARTTRSRKRTTETRADSAQAIRDSAQKIWLAGLGAFERAKTEGPKMFETLVDQGRAMGARAAGAADEAMRNMRQAGIEGAGRWDKLEQVFEDRVSKSLSRLGVITSREVEELSKQVEELNRTVRGMMSRPGASKPAAAKKRAAPRKRKAAARSKKAS
jgi:poly(hydroxyalkanoate) granule-associated protein